MTRFAARSVQLHDASSAIVSVTADNLSLTDWYAYCVMLASEIGGTMEASPRVADAVQRLKGIFLEMPGTQLSMADATRLSGLERPVCRIVLEALEESHFLKRRRDGVFMRQTPDSVDR